MPSSGTPVATAARIAARHSRVERARRAEVADARHDDRRAARAALTASAGVKTSAPIAAKRLSHRGQVAGAVVDECDHMVSMRSFTAVPWCSAASRASRLSLAQATRSARANALNTASIWWWLDRPYSTFMCTLARAPCANPSKKSCDQLGLQIADASASSTLQIDDRVRPAAEIDGRHGQRLVHRHDEVAGAVDAAPVAERLDTASPRAMPTSSTV